MGLLKLFGGKPPEEIEAKGDKLFEAGDFGPEAPDRFGRRRRR